MDVYSPGLSSFTFKRETICFPSWSFCKNWVHPVQGLGQSTLFREASILLFLFLYFFKYLFIGWGQVLFAACGIFVAGFSLVAVSRQKACGLSSCGTGFICPAAWGNLSSLTRNQTHIPCLGRWNLNHWTLREVPVFLLIFLKVQLWAKLYPFQIPM